MPNEPADVVSFWLQDCEASPEALKRDSKIWYRSSEAFDQTIQDRFGDTLQLAEQGQLSAWQHSADGLLALVILLDQFSRNLYRHTADAYRNDAQALLHAEHAVDHQLDKQLSLVGRLVLYHPFHHAEDLAAQQQSVKLYTGLAEDAGPEWSSALQSFLTSAKGHHDIVAAFGRFPHRNAVLNRQSTAEELEHLAKHKRRFGQ